MSRRRDKEAIAALREALAARLQTVPPKVLAASYSETLDYKRDARAAGRDLRDLGTTESRLREALDIMNRYWQQGGETPNVNN